MSSQIYIALGTNLGDRLGNLRLAISLLPPKVKVIQQSPIYQTDPWGYSDQPDFLNQVISAETDLPPKDLLRHLKQIEADVGRKPTFRYGPRMVDLDILFYDDWIFEDAGLQIPHPRLHERAFVLVPLADLAPDLCHPQIGLTIQQLLEQTDISGVVRFMQA